MSHGTPDPAAALRSSSTGLSPSPAGFSKTFPLTLVLTYAVHYPAMHASRFRLFPFRSPLLRKSMFFLFLRLLRCFSSPGSPPCAMDSRMDGMGFPCRVSPFRHPRIAGYLLLPGAFRSLSRLSSAPGAKASALRPF